ELDSLIETLNLSDRDRFVGVAPFSHVNGLMRSMMASVRAGASLFAVPRFERNGVADLIERERITIFIAVPFMFGMLAKSRFRTSPDFSSLRLCVSASAPMPEKANKEFQQKFGIFVRQLYGSTETGTISVNLADRVEDSLLSVGTPIHGVEVEVFTDEGIPAAKGDLGEFAVKSPAAITAYRGAEEANQKDFRGGYFFTGDRGRRDREGLLYLAGRKKFFINKGGYKINPQEIEDLIGGHPKVEEVAVIGVPTAFEDEKVKAVVVTSEACRTEDIVEYCKGKIADFKIPSLVEFRESLPKSPTGKVRKKLL
ncbi:MAG: class I adenylate-forming enzyme family protein, partial [bacterium]